jgi:hypothetical protein
MNDDEEGTCNRKYQSKSFGYWKTNIQALCHHGIDIRPGTGVGPHRHLSFSEINIVAEGRSKAKLTEYHLPRIGER